MSLSVCLIFDCLFVCSFLSSTCRPDDGERTRANNLSSDKGEVNKIHFLETILDPSIVGTQNKYFLLLILAIYWQIGIEFTNLHYISIYFYGVLQPFKRNSAGNIK